MGAPLIHDMNVIGILTKKLGNRLIYAGFTYKILESISSLQKEMVNVSYFLNHHTHKGIRKVARWEQNYRKGMAAHFD